MKNEYFCWLQDRRIKPEYNVPKIIYIKNNFSQRHKDTKNTKTNKGIIDQAVKELINGIKRILGFTLAVGGKTDKPRGAFYLGIVSDNLPYTPTPNPGCEGFAIKAADNSVFIIGNDAAGLLYGVFRFLFLLSLGQIKEGFELKDSPVSSLRMINHWDNLDGTIERGYAGGSLFFKNGRIIYSKKRMEDYARLLASVGINSISINNVNVRGSAKLLITEKYLKDVSKLAAIFRPFGIKLLLSVNFNSPISIGKLSTSDPLDKSVIKWWKERAKLIYKHIPDLKGFLVKADSEGEAGPFQYGRTHADGANMLANALKPFGGVVIWRCFVYNCTQDWRDRKTDRARAACDNFMPLDGEFRDNVILQIKHGPYDFQVREPVSPLFGALKKTRHVMELQITQEYTGHQIDLCYLPFMWEDIMKFDTAHGKESRIKDLVTQKRIEGFAAVSNTGLDKNWTGHTLAQANLYGYARMAWNPSLSAEDIAREWSALSFGINPQAEKIKEILLRSYPAYEKYTSPFGVCFMVTPGSHYGPNIEGYEFSRWGTYHRADKDAIGIDRTSSGTGYTKQYSKKNVMLFSCKKTCPENLILFFHRLRYDFVMQNGKTLLQNIYDTHFEGYDEAANMLEDWKKLKGKIENAVYESVLSRFRLQLENAREWRDQINTYFYRKTGIADGEGRKIYG